MYKKNMTIPEFMSGYRQHEEEIAQHIIRNKKIKKMVIFVIACLLFAQHAQDVYAVGNTVKIDKAGIVILGICRNIGYWACIIMCVIEIIKTLMQGDTKGVSKVIAKYLLGFGALYLVPWMFDLIKSIFS
jgi:hypothetical protein